jgi:hypothetical protein
VFLARSTEGRDLLTPHHCFFEADPISCN